MDMGDIKNRPTAKGLTTGLVAGLDLPMGIVQMSDWRWSEPMEISYPGHDLCYLAFLFDKHDTASHARYLGTNVSRLVGKTCFVPTGHAIEGTYAAMTKRVLSCFVDPAFFAAAGGDKINWDSTRLAESLDINNPRIEFLLHRIGTVLSKPSFASDVIIEGLMHVAVGELLEHFHDASAGSSRDGGLPAWRMRVIKERINDGPAVPTIEELARQCRLTPRHLMRAFKQETGETIGTYIKRAQMERAKAMLGTDMPIGCVAKMVGFSGTSGFSFAFRRETGVSPHQYRKAL